MTAFAEAVGRLRTAQKPGRGAPPYSRWINRRLGRLLAAAAHLTGRTPNQVTVVSALFSFGAIAVLALTSPTVLTGLTVCLLLVIGYALDAADGQLARLRGGGSVAGEWLDHIVDAAKICLLHSAVAISLFRFGPGPRGLLLIPLGYQAVASVFFFSFILVDKLRGERPNQGDAPAKPGSGLLQTIAALPTDYGVLCLVFAVLGVRWAFVWAYSTMFALNAAVLALVLIRWWGEMQVADRAAATVAAGPTL